MCIETHPYNHQAAFSPFPEFYFVLAVDMVAFAENWIHSQLEYFDRELKIKEKFKKNIKKKSYFPQIFLIPFGLFLFSGDNGDCGPESVPEERGESSSMTTVPAPFSVSPGLRTVTVTFYTNY